MKSNLIEIVAVIDRSGSMTNLAIEASAAFNSFITDQRAVAGECKLTLIHFDNMSEVVHDGVDLKDVPPFQIVPRGMTAMYDAIGQAIATVGARLAKTDEDDRPSKVLVVIVTDGEENASKEYTQAQVKAMIETQQRDYSWVFEFMAANIDTAKAAGSVGIPVASSYSYESTKGGTRDAYMDLSLRTRSLRS